MKTVPTPRQPAQSAGPIRTDHLERALTAVTASVYPDPPRALHDLCQQGARMVACGECGQQPGKPCADAGGLDGYHLGRFIAARATVGLLTGSEMSEVVAAAGAFTPAAIVRDGAEVTEVPPMAALRAQVAWLTARLDEHEQAFAMLDRGRSDSEPDDTVTGRPHLALHRGGAA
jgi:hypothetical protein